MKPVMTPEDVSRALQRIAHEIIENNRGAQDLLLLGIHTRGVPMAHRLEAAIGLYRDDLGSRPTPSLDVTTLPVGIDDLTVILVDDVLYTGRTIRAALDAMADLGRAARVQLAVLVDRGHRQLPIRADYVGKNLPTNINERVTVHLREIDDEDGVWLEAPAQAVTRTGDE